MTKQVVGTVVGVTNPREFYFSVTPGTVQLQDLVCVDMRLEKSETGGTGVSRRDEEPVRVWAKVANIERINPLFPEEAAQELSTQRLTAFDTVISLSREMITAKCAILGKEEYHDGNVELRPLTYPLQPASSVYLGDPETVEKLLIGNIPQYRRLKIGHLRGRPEFSAYLDAHAIVARHLAVMAATGAGKTVTVRKLLEELALNSQYPILIFDPHSDYIGLGELPELKERVTVYFPALHLADEDIENIIALVRDLSGESLTSPQESLLKGVIELVRENWSETNGYRWDERDAKWTKEPSASGWAEQGFVYRFICPTARRKHYLNLSTRHFYCLQEVLDTLESLRQAQTEEAKKVWSEIDKELRELGRNDILGQLSSSHRPVIRQLGRAGYAYSQIRKMNRARLMGVIETKGLPKPSDMQEVIQKGKISVVSLEGYTTHATAIVANLMRQLLDLRLENKVPRFITIVEEAHNFAPGASEIPAPSMDILRQVATEGRKYGMGLVLISQRPSRVDATVLSQCNSFIILKIINPADQKYVRDVVETLGEDDAKILPDLATGEALITGECVQFPILVQVEMPRSRGRHEEEDFIREFVSAETPDVGARAPQPERASEQPTLVSPST